MVNDGSKDQRGLARGPPLAFGTCRPVPDLLTTSIGACWADTVTPRREFKAAELQVGTDPAVLPERPDVTWAEVPRTMQGNRYPVRGAVAFEHVAGAQLG